MKGASEREEFPAEGTRVISEGHIGTPLQRDLDTLKRLDSIQVLLDGIAELVNARGPAAPRETDEEAFLALMTRFKVDSVMDSYSILLTLMLMGYLER